MYRQQKYILDCYVRTDTTKNDIIKRFSLCESNYCLYYSFYHFLSFPFLEIYIYLFIFEVLDQHLHSTRRRLQQKYKLIDNKTLLVVA